MSIQSIATVLNRISSEETTAEQNRALDDAKRRAYFDELPTKVARLVKVFLDDVSEEEMLRCRTSSNREWARFEFRAELPAFAMKNYTEIPAEFVLTQDETVFMRLAKTFANNDVELMKSLHELNYSGAGIENFVCEGLYSHDNLGETNHQISAAIKEVCGISGRIVTGTSWGKRQITLSLTFPLTQNNREEATK